MSIKEIRTFLDIQDAIISRAKLEDKTSVRNILKEKINTANNLIGFEEEYRWSGETKPLILKAKYTTGTVALTAGSDLATGTSTAWTQFDHEGLKFYVSGVNHAFKILRIDASGQVATLDSPWTGSAQTAATYSIYKDEHGLFPDCQAIRKLWIPGLSSAFQPTPCGPNEIDSIRAVAPLRAGSPVRYTMNGYGIYTNKTWATFNLNTDYWEDDYDATPRNQQLVLWPCILTTDTIAMIRYTKIMPMLNEDGDEPLMPYEVRSRIVFEVLVDHFITNRDASTKREWKEQRNELKNRMEADIETTDDELILTVDRSGYNRRSQFGIDEDCES